jgi:hypothetical protein
MKEGTSEISEKLNEALISMRRDIRYQISDIQRQLNGQMRTEMKVTSENYKRPLIDCGDLDEGQSSGIYKIFPEDSLDGFDVYCDLFMQVIFNKDFLQLELYLNFGLYRFFQG